MTRLKSIVEVALASIVLLSIGGCQSPGGGLIHHPVELKEPEVFVSPIAQYYDRPRLAILYFFAPPYARGAVDVVTTAYTQALVRSGLFRQVAVLKQTAPEDMSVLDVSSVSAQDYDLVLRGKIDYLLAGTGASRNELAAEVQLVAVSPPTLRWYVKQQAASVPGSDTDLIWSTIPGQPAVSYQVLAESLAKQFAELIIPSGNDTQPVPVKSPLSGSKAPQ
jgi:hypothetical protein